MLTDFQKEIYNYYLLCYRNNINEPFSPRKNFNNFEIEKQNEYNILIRLEKFFSEYKNINPKLFFKAGFYYNKNQKFLPLDFFITYQAIKLYVNYIKILELLSPDDYECLNFIKDSLIYIKNYCVNKKINLKEYTKYKENGMYIWQNHLIGNKISFYIIFGLEFYNSQMYDYFYEMPIDEFEMISKKYVEKYKEFKKRFNESKIAKNLIIEGLKKVNFIINENIKNNNDTKGEIK